MDLDGGDTPGIDVWKRIQQDVLDRAEDGRGRPHPQAEGQDSQKRKSWTIPDAADPVADVLPERVHDGT